MFLFLYVAYGNLIFMPQSVHGVFIAEDVFYGSIPRPWNDLKSRTVELTQEVRVLIHTKK